MGNMDEQRNIVDGWHKDTTHDEIITKHPTDTTYLATMTPKSWGMCRKPIGQQPAHNKTVTQNGTDTINEVWVKRHRLTASRKSTETFPTTVPYFSHKTMCDKLHRKDNFLDGRKQARKGSAES